MFRKQILKKYAGFATVRSVKRVVRSVDMFFVGIASFNL
jgi:hypothetical protein